MENKLIENLVNETLQTDSKSKEWVFNYIPNLKCYWLKERDWYFPEEIIEKYTLKDGYLDLDLDSLFETFNTTKFKVKKNEGENTLIISIETINSIDSSQAA